MTFRPRAVVSRPRRFASVAFGLGVALLLHASASEAAAAERPLVISTLPFDNAEEQRAVFGVLSRELASRLGRPVRFEAGATYDQVIERLGKGTIDVAFIGAAAYIKARRNGEVRAILRTIRHRTTSYYGVVVVKTGANINGLAALKGKTFAFVDRASSAGFVFPRQLLRKAGLDPDKDIVAIYPGSHRGVVEAVVSGKAVAGACFEGAQDSLSDPAAVTPIARTEPIPGDPVVVRAGLGAELVQNLRRSLVELAGESDAQSFFTFAEIDGFVPALDTDYDGVAALMRSE